MHSHSTRVNARKINDALQIAWKTHNGKILARASKVECGIKEEGALANQQLQLFLAPHGYTPPKYAPLLWKCNAIKTILALLVEDFGVKHLSKKKSEQFTQVLKDKHEVEVN